MNKKPLILEIKGNSLDDGHGIRTVIFFKGCPLSCSWCHNPESKRPGVEISFDAKECVGCNTCLEICPDNALSRDNPFYIDRDKCSLCFECVEACPSGALSRVGRPMSIDEILGAVLKDKPFFDTSGGGVTLSGGEPTLFMDFTSDLTRRLKELDIHILIETCGYFDCHKFTEILYPNVDTIYYDIKILDSDDHQDSCGKGSERILKNFETLYRKYLDGGVEVLPRIPLVPGITATGPNLTSIASFLRKMGVKKIVLLPYNPLWREKAEKLGVQSPFGGTESMKTWMKQEKIEYYTSLFDDFEIDGVNRAL